MIGGISYFHEYAYDLIATNERIIAATCDAAIAARARRAAAEGDVSELVDGVRVDRALALARGGRAARSRRRSRRTASRSSRSSTSRARPGISTGCRTRSCAPSTAWGSASGARAATSRSCPGNVRLAMSHVVPDLVQKVLKGQDPLHILGVGRPGAALHLRRRPRARDRDGDGAPGGAERGLQPLDGRRRQPCSSSPS